jgi:TolB-like protein/Flp pilus assembly protein TadD
MSLFSELKRRNVFRVAIAYLAAAWLLTEVGDTLFGAFGVPDWATRFIVIVLALGFFPALIFSWVYELTPEGLKRERDVVRRTSITHKTAKRLDLLTIGMIVLALGFIFYDRYWLGVVTNQPSDIATESINLPLQKSVPGNQYPSNSIAVLPFINMSSDVEQEYFSDGISEELLNLLARLPELQVIARTSSFAFKGKEVTIAEIAQELNVAYVLEGSVRKSGDQIRITAQLIRSTDSSHLWSETYDRTMENIFAIQDDIASAVVDELRVMLLGESVPQSTATDPEAYALYLQGRHLNDQLTQAAYGEAEELLKLALSIDPGFAPAWRQLGIAYLNQQGHELSVDEARKLAREAFASALAIDPEDAQLYASLSLLARMNYNYSAADEYLQQALQLQDNSGFPFAAAASLSRTFGRFEKSIDLAKKSISYNPVNSNSYANLGYSYYYANRLDEAAAAFTKAASLNPENFRSQVYLGRVLLAQGFKKKALGVIQKASDYPYRLAGLAMAHHVLGDSAASDQALRELTEKWGDTMAFQIAEVYAVQGNDNAAFEWLNRAFDSKDAGLNVLLGNPAFNQLTLDNRYQLMVEKLGLTTYWEALKLKQI